MLTLTLWWGTIEAILRLKFHYPAAVLWSRPVIGVCMSILEFQHEDDDDVTQWLVW
jgi:hypothetical protein